MISTFVFGGIIPSTLLAVDGSARTLIWVDVVPSTGATVGAGGGGSGVSDGTWVRVTGNVDVTGAAVAVDIISLRIGAPQAVLKKTTALKTTIEGLMDTAGL